MRVLWSLPVLFLLSATMSAQAGARDDATSGAYRCSPIGGLRQWLDCFYGAAQPVRAQLGMTPAPAAQVRLSQNPQPGSIPSGDSRLRGDVMSAVLRCYQMPEDRQWLDCYYGAAQPVRARLGLSAGQQASALNILDPAGQHVAGRPGPDGAAEDQFGLATSRARGRDADHVVARMTSYEFSRFKIFTVSLSNGQVWRQLSGDTTYAHWNKPAASYTVTISHGAFGSFKLQVKDIPAVFKVERVK